MTELLRQVIAQIEKLPLDRQNEIAVCLLAELQNADAIDTSNRWNEQDRSDVTDFSLQCADSTFK
jgi:hypothetical protein